MTDVLGLIDRATDCGVEFLLRLDGKIGVAHADHLDDDTRAALGQVLPTLRSALRDRIFAQSKLRWTARINRWTADDGHGGQFAARPQGDGAWVLTHQTCPACDLVVVVARGTLGAVVNRSEDLAATIHAESLENPA